MSKSLIPKLKFQSEFSDVINGLKQKGHMQHHHGRSVSIKINRHKLPADFFPRTQSVRKSKLTNEKRKYNQLGIRKAESERDHYSPEKTSFFGFFEDKSNKTNSQINTLKRKFESRQQPKRQKLIPQFRHLTPMNGTQRADLLNLYSDRPDIQLTEALISSTKSKGLQISPRKQHFSKYQGLNKMKSIEREDRCDVKEEQNSYNITFFNGKSTCFPPINQNKA